MIPSHNARNHGSLGKKLRCKDETLTFNGTNIQTFFYGVGSFYLEGTTVKTPRVEFLIKTQRMPLSTFIIVSVTASTLAEHFGKLP